MVMLLYLWRVKCNHDRGRDTCDCTVQTFNINSLAVIYSLFYITLLAKCLLYMKQFFYKELFYIAVRVSEHALMQKKPDLTEIKTDK